MKIQVDNKAIILDGARLIYDLYFFPGDGYDDVSLPAKAKDVFLLPWARAIQKSSDKGGPLFLPYAPDDEWIECLKAILKDDKIVLNLVQVGENGYAVDFGDFETFITSPHEIDEESPEVFGEFNKDEFVQALVEAEVIDE